MPRGRKRKASESTYLPGGPDSNVNTFKEHPATRPVRKSVVAPDPSPPARPAGYRTTSAADVRQLHAAGILAVNTYGSPLVYEYAPEDAERIRAVLG